MSNADTVPAAIAAPQPRLRRAGTIEAGIGAAIVLGWLITALGANWLAPADPNALDLMMVLAPPGNGHWFGTDNLGRDVLSRVIHGARIDIWMGFIGVLIPLVVGVSIGLISGYFGGLTDTVLMRLVDITVAFPFFILVIAIVGVLGPGLANYFIALGLVAWVAYARLVRAEVLIVRRMEYVQAARALGYSDRVIVLRHVLPNVLGSITIYAWTDAVLVILAGASLGFLGLGAQPPTAEWGVMIAEGQPYIVQAWWICLFPGLAMVTLALGFILISDGLSRRLRVSA